MKGLTWNVRGWREKSEEIVERVREVDIAIITETKGKRTDHYRIPGYGVIKCNDYNLGEGGAGGVAIFYRTEMVVTEIENIGKEIEGIEWTG